MNKQSLTRHFRPRMLQPPKARIRYPGDGFLRNFFIRRGSGFIGPDPSKKYAGRNAGIVKFSLLIHFRFDLDYF